MREFEHERLFRPPGGTGVIIVPVLGECIAGRATLEDDYGLELKRLMPTASEALGFLFDRLGRSPHPITQPASNGAARFVGWNKVERILTYHVVVLPTRPTRDSELSVDYLAAQVRRLRTILREVSWLRDQPGDIVFPRIMNERGWDHWRGYWETWLPEPGYVIISGGSP